MQLLKELATGNVAEANGIDVLNLIESFLVRRSVCGHEPTGLHAVFKGLWSDCAGEPTAESVAAAIRNHKTVVWPSTAEVKNCALTRPLYGSAITSFLLIEWNRCLGGDVPSHKPWIEHVLPDTMSADWKLHFTEKQHEELKDRLANLIPLSQPMNQGLGNASYATKRKKYEEDSMFKAARDFAKDYIEWGPSQIESRAVVISEWVAERWPS